MVKASYKRALQDVGALLDLWIPMKIRYDQTPSYAIGIVHNGRIVYERGIGYASFKPKQPTTPRHNYHIASISKTFTAISIMQLVERKKLRLTDPIAKYIPWFIGTRRGYVASRITIRDLMSHTSGVFRDGTTPHWTTGTFPKKLSVSFSPDALIQKRNGQFKYSNYGYAVLGELIERVSGMSYTAYVKKNILRPLGLTKTAGDYDGTIKPYATGYERIIPNRTRRAFPHHITYAYAAATGFVSNVHDLCAYVTFLSGKHTNGDQVLTRASLATLMKAVRRTNKEEMYGLGFDLDVNKKRTLIGHGGGFNGFSTVIGFEPKSSIGVIVLSNANSSDAPAVGTGILDTILDIVYDKTSKKIPSTRYKKYEGIYRSIWSDGLIAQIGNRLISFSPSATSPLKNAAVLVPSKNRDTFTIRTKNKFDYTGENARFASFKNGHATILYVGPNPHKRVEI